MYPKSRNDLDVFREDVAEKTKGLTVKKLVLLRVNRGSDNTK